MSKILVILEAKDAETLRSATLPAITFARSLSQNLGTSYSFALLGHGVSKVADSARAFGANEVFVADDAVLDSAAAELCVPILKQLVLKTGATHVVGAATALGKDLLPRLAAALDAAYVGDCIGFEDSPEGIVWKRPLCAGNAIAYCRSETPSAVIAVRSTEFESATSNGGLSPIVAIAPTTAAESPATRKRLRGFEAVDNNRPELTEARVVVSGGRALAGRFFEILGPLADSLGAALGATRAACDDGHAPGDFQVGQTGKVVAPDLYFAVGISGAIQHVAGMKGARVVVAINSDPQAPIVSVADYTLVGDLFRLVPELVKELQKHAENS